MKKLVLAGLMVSVMAFALYAQDGSTVENAKSVANNAINWGDIIQATPAVKSGVFYNINDSKFQVINSLTIVEYKFASFDAGYADQGIVCASVNFDLIKLEALGVKFPFFKDIVAGAGWTAGFKRIALDNEFVTGPSVVLKVKF